MTFSLRAFENSGSFPGCPVCDSIPYRPTPVSTTKLLSTLVACLVDPLKSPTIFVILIAERPVPLGQASGVLSGQSRRDGATPPLRASILFLCGYLPSSLYQKISSRDTGDLPLDDAFDKTFPLASAAVVFFFFQTACSP